MCLLAAYTVNTKNAYIVKAAYVQDLMTIRMRIIPI